MNEEADRPSIAAPPNPHVKLLIEFGPLAAFGVTYFTAGSRRPNCDQEAARAMTLVTMTTPVAQKMPAVK